MRDGTVVIPADPGMFARYVEEGQPCVAYVIGWELEYADGDLMWSAALVVEEGWDASDHPVSHASKLSWDKDVPGAHPRLTRLTRP